MVAGVDNICRCCLVCQGVYICVLMSSCLQSGGVNCKLTCRGSVQVPKMCVVGLGQARHLPLTTLYLVHLLYTCCTLMYTAQLGPGTQTVNITIVPLTV